jgi:hypothetical protein
LDDLVFPLADDGIPDGSVPAKSLAASLRILLTKHLLRVNDEKTVVVPRRLLGLSGSCNVEQWSWLKSWVLEWINWLRPFCLSTILEFFPLELSGTGGERTGCALHIVRHHRNAIPLEGRPPQGASTHCQAASVVKKGAIVQLDKGGRGLEVSPASGLVHKPG